MSSVLLVHVLPSETLGIARLHVHDEEAGKARMVESNKGLFASGIERERALAKHPDAFWLLPTRPSATWELPQGETASWKDCVRAARSLSDFLNARLAPWIRSFGGSVPVLVTTTSASHRGVVGAGRRERARTRQRPLKIAPVERLADAERLKKALRTAQREVVAIVEGGRPIAALVGVPESWDLEDFSWATDGAFWQQLERSRAGSRMRTRGR